MNKFILSITTAAAFMASGAIAATIVSVEAPGVQSTTIGFGQTAVENFDALTPGMQAPVNTSFAAIGVSAIFSMTLISAADQFGGAGGIGNQVAINQIDDLDISFTGTPLNYFGLWASSLDGNNTVTFFQGLTQLSSTNLTIISLGPLYNGNPNGNFLNQNNSEKYAFFNFRVTEGFDRVVLSQNGGGGFELDNVTIGFVPEPGTWAMLITGFGMIGFAARRRRIAVAA